jgi:hypothetical protein
VETGAKGKTTYRQSLQNPCNTTGILWLVVSEELDEFPARCGGKASINLHFMIYISYPMDILMIIQLVEGDRLEKMFSLLTFSFSGQVEYLF